MKTIVTYKDGTEKVFQDGMPSPYLDEFDIIDDAANVLEETVPLDTVARVVFIND